MTKKSTKTFLRHLQAALDAVPDANPRAADALRSVLNATLDATRALDEDEAAAVHDLEALRPRTRKPQPKKADERAQFLQVLRHSLSSWRLPPPSAGRRQPTLRDIAVQLARTLEQEHGRKIAEDAGVIPPPTADIADRILIEWSKHVESSGEYQLGDAGSERMIVDAFRAFGIPRRTAEGLYDFAHPKKRVH